MSCQQSWRCHNNDFPVDLSLVKKGIFIRKLWLKKWIWTDSWNYFLSFEKRATLGKRWKFRNAIVLVENKKTTEFSRRHWVFYTLGFRGRQSRYERFPDGEQLRYWTSFTWGAKWEIKINGSTLGSQSPFGGSYGIVKKNEGISRNEIIVVRPLIDPSLQ